MRLTTTFTVELKVEGEDPVIFTFRTPKLNQLHKNQVLLKKLRSEDVAEAQEAQIEITQGIIDSCLKAEGFIDEDGNDLGSEGISELPLSCLSALIAAYHQGSAEAVKGKKLQAEPTDSAGA